MQERGPKSSHVFLVRGVLLLFSIERFKRKTKEEERSVKTTKGGAEFLKKKKDFRFREKDKDEGSGGGKKEQEETHTHLFFHQGGK